MAMRHSSYVNEHHMGRLDCNERLEFLGDAVLELVSSEFLYRNYPELPEGELTKLRASLVCEPTLAMDARALDLGEYLLLGKGEEATRRRPAERFHCLRRHGGYHRSCFLWTEVLRRAGILCARFVLNDVQNKQMFQDSKTILQEMVQKEFEGEVSYRILEEAGPDHDKSFRAQVAVGDRPLGEGTGRTKKAAEQQAAYNALCRLRADR